MVGQHRYEINLKQGDLFINLSSDDLYFISKQMDKWCQILMDDSYIPISIPSSAKPAGPQPAPSAAPVYEAPPQPVYAQSAQPQVAYAPPPQPYMPQPQPVAYAAPQQAVVPTAAPQYYEPQPVAQAAPPLAPPPPVPDYAPAAPSSQPAFVQEVPVAQPAPSQQAPQVQLPLQEASTKTPKDEFEVVMDSLMKEFEEDAPTRPNLPFAGQVAQAPSADLAGVSTLLELCDRAQAESSEDYLLLSAYYLTYFEKEEKFSLKRINAMLVKTGLTPVNHSVLEATLGRGYLYMVPDTTGLAEVSEYVLTEEGQQAAKQLFLR
jgi:hypothetical protein